MCVAIAPDGEETTHWFSLDEIILSIAEKTKIQKLEDELREAIVLLEIYLEDEKETMLLNNSRDDYLWLKENKQIIKTYKSKDVKHVR